MAVKNGYDITEGVIIGGEDDIYWRLFYDGKSYSGRTHAYSEAEALEAARTLKHELIAIAAIIDPGRYRDDSKWEMRIYT